MKQATIILNVIVNSYEWIKTTQTQKHRLTHTHVHTDSVEFGLPVLLWSHYFRPGDFWLGFLFIALFVAGGRGAFEPNLHLRLFSCFFLHFFRSFLFCCCFFLFPSFCSCCLCSRLSVCWPLQKLSWQHFLICTHRKWAEMLALALPRISHFCFHFTLPLHSLWLPPDFSFRW